MIFTKERPERPPPTPPPEEELGQSRDNKLWIIDGDCDIDSQPSHIEHKGTWRKVDRQQCPIMFQKEFGSKWDFETKFFCPKEK